MRTTILIILFYSSVFGQKTENQIISFDGIYETKCDYANDEEGEKSFLRFYTNNKVLSIGTVCDATVDDLKVWFNMKMDDKSIGDYKIKGDRIKFFTTNSIGIVKYRGRITKNGILELKIKSLINGYRSREKYQFIKVVGLN